MIPRKYLHSAAWWAETELSKSPLTTWSSAVLGFWLWRSAMCCLQATRAQVRRMNWCKIFSVTKESQSKTYRRLYSWIIKYSPRECSGWAVLCSLAWRGSSALAGVADSHIVGTPIWPPHLLQHLLLMPLLICWCSCTPPHSLICSRIVPCMLLVPWGKYEVQGCFQMWSKLWVMTV